ncbi:dodecenoyl-CoA isomerase [Candidozyma auris]|uniref:Uncharacterized protein n=2 Tax=Candidozyma auris TaxID=498019 RepID=A0A2H0ZC37_CANAR|nr:hypothetical_protein [[Candida] auris]KNE01656.1 hypothetical protein QG37_00991 [[Candida] auris]PIS48221.1 hypothetical protein B9J08_004905 [[Candida] auris]PIS48834.1 hypothetical protein CJI97_004989 [[Candida] auris]PSK78323.1 hypothetical protein CJJ07_001863 [[Candida] auris]QEO22815.1 hypothetical_protein [[Candida] auris]
MSDDEYTDILYEVRDRITTITINLDSKLNALNGPQYLQLAKFIDQADKEEDTVVTILQAKGRYFSAGANVRDISVANADPSEIFSHEFWLKNFTGRNVYLTDLLHNHSKVLVCALNGPVIGLSAAIVALCDLVYVNDENTAYMLTPFSNLGLVAEGATSATLFLRLGWSKSAEALLFAKPIPGSELNRLGFFNGTFTGKGLTTDQFNEEVHKLVLSKFEGLYEPSIFANKALLRHNRDQLINSANARESIIGFNRWIEGIPQQRFVQIANKEIKHKL